MSELAKNLSITALMLVVKTLAAKELYDINRTTENFEFLCEKRGKLETYIAELEAAQRWRVVADGELPEHDGEYWVWLEAWNTPHKRGACIYSKDYHDNNGFFNLIPVTHWMPLPKPPEVQQ